MSRAGRDRNVQQRRGAEAVWTADSIRALGVRMNATTYFSILGVSERTGYEWIKSGKTPTPALRLGNRYVFATRPLLAWLGETDEDGPSDRPRLSAVPDPPDAAA